MTGLINGSPRETGSNSETLLQLLQKQLPSEQRSCLYSANHTSAQIYADLCECDTILIVFPLYVDALPSHLLQFLMGLEAYRAVCPAKKEPHTRLYAVVQCGFYEGRQCCLALDILKNFCSRAGFLWCGGVGLGGAGALKETPTACWKPFLTGLQRLAEACTDGRSLPENLYTSIGIPRWLYILMGNRGWLTQAKRNGISKKALSTRKEPPANPNSRIGRRL